MIIQCITGGSFLTNCYIIADEESKEGIIIDPGAQLSEVLEEIKNLDLRIDKIVNTHAHIDHASGVQEAKDALGAKFYLHPKENLFSIYFQNLRLDSRNFRVFKYLK